MITRARTRSSTTLAVAVTGGFSAVADIDKTPRNRNICVRLSRPASHIPTKSRGSICDAAALANGLQLGTMVEQLKTE
ncbi:hypothetical protein GCM10010425_23590 [Streptomyces spororaveus]